MPAVAAAGGIIQEITCVIAGVLVIFDINNPLAKLCPSAAKSTITVMSGKTSTSTFHSTSHSTSFSTSHSSSTSHSTSHSTSTSHSASPSITSTISVGSSTSIVLSGTTQTTLTVPTTTSVTSSTPLSSSTSVPTTTLALTSSSTTTTASTSAASPTGYDAFNCPAGLPYSCQNTTVQDNTCCFESPGGLILQTQFWDTNPASGPNNSWTIHGLWPDNCDGTYQQYCDESRQYTNITQILQSFGDQDLLDYMNTYWTSNSGTAESFWEHEFGKHGTCMSTFDTQCYPNYVPTQEVPDFFNRTVQIFKTLPSYDWLAEAGIVPSTTVTYTAQQFQDALSPHHGGNQVYLGCSNGQIDELWYYYYVQGSVQDGNLMPTEFGSSSCPATGINYYPKGYVPPTTTSASPTGTSTATATTSACSTATAVPFAGKGYLYVYDGGIQQGFVISAGKWYNTAGTPATITSSSTTGEDSFTLKTSKGLCEIQADSSLFCDASVTTGSSFTADGSVLQYDGSDVFGSTGVPSGTAQGTIYVSSSQTVSITLEWVAKC